MIPLGRGAYYAMMGALTMLAGVVLAVTLGALIGKIWSLAAP